MTRQARRPGTAAASIDRQTCSRPGDVSVSGPKEVVRQYRARARALLPPPLRFVTPCERSRAPAYRALVVRSPRWSRYRAPCTTTMTSERCRETVLRRAKCTPPHAVAAVADTA